MKKILKWIGIVLGSLIGLVVIAGFVFFMIGNGQLNKVYQFPPSNITIPTDAASLEYGQHRVETLCTDCHGKDLSGSSFLEDPMMGVMDAPNITAGEGGIGQIYISDEDYVSALRHGINPEGKPIFMPAVNATSYLSDEDLGAVIAYLKTVPPVDNMTRERQFTPLASILFGLGMLPPLPVEVISHEIQIIAPEQGVSVAYGGYLVDTVGCRDCHGMELAGGQYPDPTVNLIVPNITPGGAVGAWSEEDFISAIRIGVAPGGYQFEIMPWETYRLLTDDELKAIYMYLQSLDPLEQITE
jgi:mono/diheme cytochrome c family protein